MQKSRSKCQHTFALSNTVLLTKNKNVNLELIALNINAYCNNERSKKGFVWFDA